MRTRNLVRRGAGERGAVLLIVAVFAIVAVIMLAAVVDLGDQRQERKEVTLSTDAAALAAAGLADAEDDYLRSFDRGVLVDCVQVGISETAKNQAGFSNVQEVVDDYLLRNGESNPVDCKVARTDYKEGYVVVSADEIVDYAFGGAIGVSQGGVSGASVAAIQVNGGGGIRPVGICGKMLSMEGVDGYPSMSLGDLADGISVDLDGSPTLYALDGDGYVTVNGSVQPYTARFPIDKVRGGECGDGSHAGSGNFGKLDFDPAATSTDCDVHGHFCKDYDDGYYDPIPADVKGDTGNNWSNTATKVSTAYLENEVGRFWAPVYEDLYKNTGVSYFGIDYFVQLRMVNHCFDGSCKFDGATWFDFEVHRMIDYDRFVDPDNFTDYLTEDFNLQQAAICAVDDSVASIAEGCPEIVTTTVTSPPSSAVPACDVLIATAQPPTYVGMSYKQMIPTVFLDDEERVPSGVEVVFELSTSSACGAMTVDASGPGIRREAEMTSVGVGVWTARFGPGTGLKRNTVFDIEVFDDGVSVAEGALLYASEAP